MTSSATTSMAGSTVAGSDAMGGASVKGEIARMESGGGSGDGLGVLATMTQLLQAQTKALAAQTRVAAAQHLPPLKPFSGEGKITEEDSFERWINHFEERAGLVGWSEAQQLYQLKLLLEKTASKVLRRPKQH